MQKRRILLIGERSSDNHGYAYADSFYEILIAQGHSVLSIDGTAVHGSWLGRTRRFELTRVERFVFDRKFNQELLAVARAYLPDICFVIKGDNIAAATIKAIKRETGCKWVLLYPDNPFMLSNGNSNAEVIKSLAHCDVVLSWAQMLIPVFKSLGVGHVCYVPFGYDERFFPERTGLNDGENFEVGFVGTADDERVELLTQLMLKLPNVKYGIWGGRWDEYLGQNAILGAAYQGAAVYKEAMVGLLRSCSIVLNPVRLQNYSSHNMRSLEAAAAGAFQLATDTHEHANVLFSEGNSIALYRNVSDLAAKITWYLSQPHLRQAIQAKGRIEAKKYSLQHILRHFFEHDLCFCQVSFQDVASIPKAVEL